MTATPTPGPARPRAPRRQALLLLGLGLLWHGPAAAFFCFSFGAGSRHRDPGPPLPALMPPPVPGWSLPAAQPPHLGVESLAQPRAIEPDLVEWPAAPDGAMARTVYRFRPLSPRPLPPIVPSAPVEQSRPF